MLLSSGEIEDRRIVAKRLFDALCAKYPDKYIALIQPSDAGNGLPSAPGLASREPAARKRGPKPA
jgi:hypothetical protein